MTPLLTLTGAVSVTRSRRRHRRWPAAVIAGLALGALVAWRAGAEEVPLPSDDATWHLLTQTEGGTITLIKGLTKHECEYARARALGEPATPEEAQAASEDFKRSYGESCPPAGADKATWKAWQATHPWALGCAKEHGGVSWGFVETSNSGMASAECFQ